MARTWRSRTEQVLGQAREWEKRIISHSRTSITKLLWTLVNILGEHVLLIEKKGEEMKRKTDHGYVSLRNGKETEKVQT